MSAPIARPELEKQRARERLSYAVKRGHVVRPERCCECAQRGHIEAHHYNGYAPERALDVKWLCRRCHREADAEAYERGRITRTGVPHSPERRAAISVATKGRTISPEHRAKISATLKDRYFSPEHRAKISAALKGRERSPEHRAALSAARKGRTLTPEQRAERIGVMAGEVNGRAKLRAVDIPAIRALHKQGMSNCAIGRLYGVHNGTISRIVRGVGWRSDG